MKSIDPDSDDIRRELERVLASAGFSRNPRMSQFLRFVVEQRLNGRGDALKEAVIAIEVFGRKPDYDPKIDSIVRTEAARLRGRLAASYAGEGRPATLVIDVPKGSYVASFRSREIVAAAPDHPQRRWRMVAAMTVAALAVAGGASWAFLRAREPISIAVMPLANLSGPSSDAFVDGLTDEIIRNLSILDGLAVRSQTSSFALKGSQNDVHEVGRKLGVEYVVEGSVLRQGEHLRIDAQLVHVRDDAAVWSMRFERTLTDIFATQDEISLAVANNLRLRLGRGRRRYETSVAAYDAYLEARGRAVARNSRGSIDSIPDFERAIALDSSFAPAYAGLASAYAYRSIQFPSDHPSDELDKMRSFAAKAIDLDPLLAEAHEGLAMTEARAGDWDRAERSFRRALELNPNASRTLANYAMWFLSVLGRNDEAWQELRRADVVDPLSSDVQLYMAVVALARSRYDEGAAHCGRMSPDNNLRIQCLGGVLIAQGKLEEAIRVLANDPDLSRNPQTRGFLGYAYARAGRVHEANDMLFRAAAPNEKALLYAGLGDKDHTFDSLRAMSVLGAQRVGQYLNSPEFAFLRADARLHALRTQVGLPD